MKRHRVYGADCRITAIIYLVPGCVLHMQLCEQRVTYYSYRGISLLPLLIKLPVSCGSRLLLRVGCFSAALSAISVRPRSANITQAETGVYQFSPATSGTNRTFWGCCCHLCSRHFCKLAVPSAAFGDGERLFSSAKSHLDI